MVTRCSDEIAEIHIEIPIEEWFLEAQGSLQTRAKKGPLLMEGGHRGFQPHLGEPVGQLGRGGCKAPHLQVGFTTPLYKPWSIDYRL